MSEEQRHTEALRAIYGGLEQQLRASFAGLSFGCAPEQPSGVPRLLLSVRRGWRTGASAQVRVEQGALVTRIKPTSRLETLLVLGLVLATVIAAAAGMFAWGLSFAPRYLQFMGQVGTVVAVVVGIGLIVSVYALLQPFTVSVQTGPLVRRLGEVARRALLEQMG